MKIITKIIFIFLIIDLILIGFHIRIYGFPYFLFPNIPKFTSIEQVNKWTFANVIYTSDKSSTGYDEYWKTPERSLMDGEGDCEDYVLLFLKIVYSQFDIKGSLITVKCKDGGYHAIALIEGQYYDPTNNIIGWYNKQYVSIVKSYSYDDVMKITYDGYFWNDSK